MSLDASGGPSDPEGAARENSRKEALEDASLVARTVEGDEVAFELLMRRHAQTAWHFARSMLSDDSEAEEAVQDAFVKVYQSVGRFRGESAFRTWLLSICYRLCLDRLRSRRVAPVPLDHVRDRGSAGESVELRLTVESVLKLAPTDERRAFFLVHGLGFTREEAAQICGVPSSTMRDRVVRVRRRLAIALSEEAITEAEV